jgi:pyridoxamine 5'-phosphate oxidase
MSSLEDRDPYELFAEWMADAEAKEPNDPNAMALATTTPDGRPSLRMVLLKGVVAEPGADGGFVFYTNFESRKGGEILANPHVALCFHWKTLRRQIRIEGPTVQVSDADADAYFQSRARDSRIGAWASQQSRPLARPSCPPARPRGLSPDRRWLGSNPTLSVRGDANRAW